MMFTQSNSQLNSNILADGEYYVFTKQEEGKIRLGYTYTTWCGSPSGTYMSFSSVQLGKPLPLSKTDGSQHDQGKLKTLKIDSRNLDLVDDIYTRAKNWLTKMPGELKYPQLDETADCQPMIIVVKQGVLSALYEKDDFLRLLS
jgi:hypothetical protein